MTTRKSPSARERRDLLAVLANGVTADVDATDLGRLIADSIRAADPCPFGPVPDDPSHEDRLRAQATRVLGELLYASSLLAVGLRPDTGAVAMTYLNSGLDRVMRSPVLRHLAECPGEPDTHQSEGGADAVG